MQVVFEILNNALLLVAIGFSMKVLYYVVNFFHIPYAINLTLASYFTYLITIQLNISIIFALPISVFLSIGLMMIVNKYIYKPLQKANTESWHMLIASLGVYVVLQNAVSVIWGDSTLSFRTWPVKEGYKLSGAYITDIQIITLFACVLLVGSSWLFLEKTSVGKKIKAVSSNPELASVVGISKEIAILWSYVVVSAMAACAGILIAADTDMIPNMGFSWMLYGVVTMIIGGMGKLRYLVFGALLLATAQNLSAYYLDSKWMNTTAYIILIVFLYFRPFGFSGQPLKKVEI